ncbi:MAG TPA: hypothetical protein VM842_03455 [Nitrospira sp.]|jgi:hypothetical protein|nr:hypothetical protein [Nitrospira sp.]
MNRRKQLFVGLACLLAGAYLVLAVISVACAAEHQGPRQSGHHHSGTVTHSGFCAWACQANPTSEAGPSALVLHPFLLVAFFIEDGPAAVAGGGLFSATSRGPPHHS